MIYETHVIAREDKEDEERWEEGKKKRNGEIKEADN